MECEVIACDSLMFRNGIVTLGMKLACSCVTGFKCSDNRSFYTWLLVSLGNNLVSETGMVRQVVFVGAMTEDRCLNSQHNMEYIPEKLINITPHHSSHRCVNIIKNIHGFLKVINNIHIYF